MARFADKTVVITGGNKGIGLAIATRFAAEGASLGSRPIKLFETAMLA